MRSHAMGPRYMLPQFFLMVQFGAIWCILGPILAAITLLVLRYFFQMLPLQTSLKIKKEKSLKCDLMVFEVVLTSAGTILYRSGFKGTRILA